MEEILHQLIGSLSHDLQGFIYPKWLFGISAINSMTSIFKLVAPFTVSNVEKSIHFTAVPAGTTLVQSPDLVFPRFWISKNSPTHLQHSGQMK